jgi:predicted nucleic acid-binding protein
MIVVADTSPLNYLILIGEIDLLPAIYQAILIPTEVHTEMLSSYAPAKVRAWAATPPHWCSVDAFASIPDLSMAELGAGERSAIQLALHRGIGTILMDDTEGRRAALLLHLDVTGTLGILEKAARLKLINFRSALTRLEQTNFRVSASIREDFLHRNP